MSKASKKYNTNAVQLRRITTACAILAIFFLVLAAYEHFKPSIENAKAYQDLCVDDNSDSDNLPQHFSEEVLSFDSFLPTSINVNDSKNVVGFICSGNVESISELITASMKANGWIFLDSGVSTILSAKKVGGKYSYAYIQITEIEEQISVVFTLN